MLATKLFANPALRMRLVLSAIAGLLAGLAAFCLLTIPASEQWVHLTQLSPMGRVVFWVKYISPGIFFVLVGAWAWGILWAIEELSSTSSLSKKTSSSPVPPLHHGQEQLLPHIELHPITVPGLFPKDPPISPLPLPITPFLPLHSEPSSAESAQTPVPEVPPPPQEVAPTTTQSELLETAQSLHLAMGGDTAEGSASHPTFSWHAAGHLEQRKAPITITLLKDLQISLHAPNGASKEVKLRSGKNDIRLILFAYIAWKKGGLLDRDKIITHVLDRGERRNQDADSLNNTFIAIKKYLREDLRKAAREFNEEAQQELIAFDSIDFFTSTPGFYQLHHSCQVLDLEEIEKHYQVILLAQKDGLLNEKRDGSIPDWVIDACQRILDAYPGDFLEDLIERRHDEFGSWVREPFTLYRDYYLEALWIKARYESALGRNFADPSRSMEENEEQRRHHQGRAAQIYYEYALTAIKSLWDTKLKFAYRVGADGERVIMSERAIRRCAVELGKIGMTDMIDRTYLAYRNRMLTLSEKHWQPDPETEADIADAKKQTDAYRFSAQLPAT